MNLAKFIDLWQSKMEAQGVDKTQAARQAVADISDEDAYQLLPIVSRLDHQVSMTSSVHRDLPTHARSALCYWLERTDTHELTRLRDSTVIWIEGLLNPLPVEIPTDEDEVKKYLSEDEMRAFNSSRLAGDPTKWITSMHLQEIARLRHHLAIQLGVAME